MQCNAECPCVISRADLKEPHSGQGTGFFTFFLLISAMFVFPSVFLFKQLLLHIKPCAIAWGQSWQEGMAHPYRDQKGSLSVLRACILQLAATPCEISNPATASNTMKPPVLLGPGWREGACSRTPVRVGRLGTWSHAGKGVVTALVAESTQPV